MLEKMVGSRTKVKILRKLVENPNRDFSFEDIAKTTNLSFGTVNPALKSLLESRIITVRKIGKSKLYKINDRHILYKEIRDVFKSEKESLIKLAKNFVNRLEKENIKNIILFGSVARGEFTERSDIDLLIIYRNNITFVKDNISKLSEELLDKYDIEIVPTYLSIREAKSRRKKFDRFIMNIINEGYVLFGDISWLEK